MPLLQTHPPILSSDSSLLEGTFSSSHDDSEKAIHHFEQRPKGKKQAGRVAAAWSRTSPTDVPAGACGTTSPREYSSGVELRLEVTANGADPEETGSRCCEQLLVGSTDIGRPTIPTASTSDRGTAFERQLSSRDRLSAGVVLDRPREGWCTAEAMSVRPVCNLGVESVRYCCYRVCRRRSDLLVKLSTEAVGVL